MNDYGKYLATVAKEKKVIGYFDTYTPEEFIIALGCHPARLLSDDREPSKAGAYLQGFCCPYAKNLLEQALAGALPFLAGVVFSRYCDSLRGVYEVWKTEKLSPFVDFIRSSQVVREEAVSYMAAEFLAVFGRVAAASGTALDAGALAEAVRTVNKKRKALQSLYAMRRDGRLCIPSEQFYRTVFSSAWLTADDFLAACKELSSKAGGLCPEMDEKKIVLSATELDNPLFFRLLDETGFFLAADDIASGSRYAKDLVAEQGATVGEIAANIARRYVMKPPCSVKDPSIRRIDELVGEVRSSGARGVVFFRTPFCDSEGVEYAFIKERLDAEKIPHVYIESDHRISNHQQVRTRLEAFYEQVVGI